MYLTYHLFEEAIDITLHILSNPELQTGKPIWLPYTQIDQLLQSVGDLQGPEWEDKLQRINHLVEMIPKTILSQ